MKRLVSFLLSVILALTCMTFVSAAPVQAAAYPSYYNSRDYGWVSGPEDQHETDCCWTFTQNELIEVSVAKKTGVLPDYSEQAMKFETSSYYSDTGYTRGPNDGGMEYMSSAYLASGGAIYESDLPFTTDDVPQTDISVLSKHGYLDHSKFYAYGVNMNCAYPAQAVEKIKELILVYGAVGSGIYFIENGGGYYFNDNNSENYYYNGTSASANHSVTIIGWDDNYSADKFSHKPAGNGAFIVKNSWGLYHNNGQTDTVYVSYYDKHITNEFFVSDYVSDNTLYDTIYQYDVRGLSQKGGYNSDSVVCINRFRAKTPNETVTAVSTYTVAPNTKVEVFVNAVDGNAENESAFKKVFERTFADTGYYLMDFEPQTLQGVNYAVAVRYSYGAAYTEFPMTGNSAGLVNNSKNYPGMCYVGTSFSNVQLIEEAFKNCNQMACIKAFTKRGAEQKITFSDVDSARWYAPAVEYVAQRRIFNGTTQTTFEPNTVMTRAMFVQVLANMSGVDTDNKNVTTVFSDVAGGSWYSPAVKWASDNGIVTGIGDNRFAPTANVTREQMCTMLVRYANYINITLKTDIPRTVFTDDGKIGNWAKEAVYACQMAGIVNGGDGNNFMPRDSAARSHVAQMLMNFCKIYV